jgi:hypothetical protein
VTRARPFRATRARKPLSTVDLLRLRRAIRLGTLQSSPTLTAAADRAAAEYADRRSEILEMTTEAERNDAATNLAASLVARADPDPAVRARAVDLHERAEQRSREFRKRR